MDASIRPYEPSDLAACRDLWRELTVHHREIYENPTIGGEEPGLQFDAYLEHPHFAAAWVATVGEAIVGLTGLLVDGAEAEMEPVVVGAGHRGRGIGRRLVEHVLGEAKRRGLPSLSVRPVARNADAIRHFHAAGFRLLGRIELFQTFEPSSQAWRTGPTLHDCELGH